MLRGQAKRKAQPLRLYPSALKNLPASKNRKAFTLIEVMVASILISVVGLSLLQMHNNSTEMSYKMQGKFQYSDWVLMAVLETKFEKAKKSTRFDKLMKPFNIDERSIRQGLNQNTKISMELAERLDAADISKGIEEESGAVMPVFEGLRLEVYKQYVEMDRETYSVYRVVKP